MAFDPVSTVVASAARNTSGNSGALNSGGGTTLCLTVNGTAHSGTTPTLDVSVEWSFDGGTTFAKGDVADTFAQRTTTDSATVKAFVIKAPFYRVVWAIAGTTPSYTFDVRAYTY